MFVIKGQEKKVFFDQRIFGIWLGFLATVLQILESATF